VSPRASSRRSAAGGAASGQAGVGLVAFLGPSLSRQEASELLRAAAPGVPFEVWGPARQGDVWRALGRRPRVLALIDGLFESAPSVWHHELLDALGGGVAVFGAASMGALRAAELRGHGMIGVGAIYQAYAGPHPPDDADVALLHAGEEDGFRPLTLPFFTARRALDEAAQARVFTPLEIRRCRSACRELHYQDRRWATLFERARVSERSRARWEEFAARGLPDPKAEDARLCLREAALCAAGLAARPVKLRAPSSALVRAKRLEALGLSAGGESDPPQAQGALQPELWNERSRTAADGDPAAPRAAEGQRMLLLAALARSMGFAPTPAQLAEALGEVLGPGEASEVEARLLALRAAPDEVARAAEVVALCRLWARHGPRLLPDGPSLAEGQRLAALLR
jgi:hypothetical protein